MTNANVVGKELAKWQSIRSQLEDLNIDVVALVDTLEGETELFEALLLLADEMAERDAMVNSVKERITDLTTRKDRLENGTTTLRSVITQAMDRAGIKTIKGDFCTLSLSEKKPGLVIVDESLLPSKYFIPQEPKLDKKALKKDVEDGVIKKGANLDNGGIKLSIRRK